MNLSKRKLMRTLTVMAASLAAWSSSLTAHAAEPIGDYPSRPITIVVGFSPGGATDVITRLVAVKLSAALGQPIVVENKPGASSNIATEAVVRAAPDGYTLLVETIANATNMSVYKNLRYDTVRDLKPIIQFMASPSVLVVTPSLPVTNLKSLIAYGKAEPGKLTFASSGLGGSPHLAGELLKLRAGIDMLHVPYKGASPAMFDVIAGVVKTGFMTSLSAVGPMQKGQLRPIAVASDTRLPELPDVPTMAEAGLPDFEVSSWNGLAAPAGTPQPIIDRLNKEIDKILSEPEMTERVQGLGAQTVGGSPEKFAAYVQAEIKKWREVVETSGISLE